MHTNGFLIKKFIFNRIFILNIITSLLLILLPYFLFKGKLYIGGDDTRLLYIYPFEFLKHITFFSWYNASTFGSNASNQFTIPFLFLWSLVGKVITSKTQLDYLSFSLPLIFAFLSMQKLTGELLDRKGGGYGFERYVGSLFYILSPIIIVDQLFIFLTTVWLFAIIPMLVFLWLRYIRTKKIIYLLSALLLTIPFSIGLFSIEWLLGIFIPILASMIISIVLFSKQDIFVFLKRSLIFVTVLIGGQSFWLFPFISSYLIKGEANFGAQILSKAVADTFVPTVQATATGTIMYPLFGIFHRQIPIDFNWKFVSVYYLFYDKIILLDSIFLVTVFVAILLSKRYLQSLEKKIFVIILIAFVISLYFFTVNIEFLKYFFFWLGHIPGFVMFRNFYDKFALGYIFIYATLLTFSLVIIRRKLIKRGIFISILLLIVIIINFYPAPDIINAKLWTTNDIGRNITIPQEYLNFSKTISDTIQPTTTILSIPFGNAAYTVIKDDNSNSVFVGTSPVRILTGVNDISGYLSFQYSSSQTFIADAIQKKEYNKLIDFLYIHNINYVMVTKNVPEQVKHSWIYASSSAPFQNDEFIRAITGKKILTSEKGNYELYTTKKQNVLIKGGDITFERINQTKYLIYISHIKSNQLLSFLDSANSGWKLYLQNNPTKSWCVPYKISYKENVVECKSNDTLIDWDSLTYLFREPIFDNSHISDNNFGNDWNINLKEIKEKYPSNMYTSNPDGSINIEFILYFQPQAYFYLGASISILTVVGVVIIFLKKREWN